MRTNARILLGAAVVAMATAGCANMTPQEKRTAIGAGVGAAAGYAVSGGNTAATAAGAVAGGVIGHEIKKDR